MTKTNISMEAEHLNGTFIDDLDNKFIYHRETFFNLLGCIITIIIALTCIIGNVSVILVSLWDEFLKLQASNILIMYLSAIDALTGIFLMLPSAVAVAADHWPLGPSACKVHAGLNYMLACSSSFNIALISVDRAIAVSYPFKYPTMMTHKIMIIFCGYIFLQSVVIGLIGGAPEWNDYDYSFGVCCLKFKTTSAEEFLQALIWGNVFCFYTPAVIISFCNAVIMITAKKSKKSVRPHLANPAQVSQGSHMRKTIKSMMVVVLMYYICFTPYSVISQLNYFVGVDFPQQYNYLATISIFISSSANPFIYAILRKDYRNAFKKFPRMLAEKCFCSY
ncbi:trace amine-associated receptor 7g-like [Argiope bruennichi]|uniref:trace amine-associated receptor 7g-like n=1 Tax=Argiope bruennichi TaxID=94029 RepID=UPI0024946185|nr:trace amine-associated receptor 7g-like [Argiope bruennichi]